MTALLYVVVVAGAVTQNECALPDVHSTSEVHPGAVQAPIEQMVEGGLQSVSLVHPTAQVPVAVVHFAFAFRSDSTQSLSIAQFWVLHRCVVASHALPAAQSRSLLHLK